MESNSKSEKKKIKDNENPKDEKDKNNEKSNTTQLTQNTNKEINLKNVTSLQDFGVEIDKKVSENQQKLKKSMYMKFMIK